MDNIKLYKKITLEIIQCLKDDKIEELEILFEKREKILQISFEVKKGWILRRKK